MLSPENIPHAMVSMNENLPHLLFQRLTGICLCLFGIIEEIYKDKNDMK